MIIGKPMFPLLLIFAIFLILTVSPSYATEPTIQNDDIERVEANGDTRTTYFKNGTKLIEVTLSQTVLVTQTVTSTITSTITPTPQIDIINILENTKLVLEVIYLTIAVISGTLVIFGIRRYLHRKKPSFYTSSNV